MTTGFTAIVFVNNAYVVWAPVFLQERFDLSLTKAGGYAMFYHHLAALLGILLRVAFRPHRGIATCVSSTNDGGGHVAGRAGDFPDGPRAESLLAVCATMAGFGLFRGLYEANTHAALFEVIAPRHRASAVGIMSMLGLLVGSLSPWLMGKFREGDGLGAGFSALSAAYLLGGLAVGAAVLFTFRRERRADEPMNEAVAPH